VGELVRQAVQTCYQTEWLGLTAAQRQALEAYRGGYVSVGKLAEAMGLSPLAAREWLSERGIPHNTVSAKNDLAHA
jgi:predicted HTH domain antitoxin